MSRSKRQALEAIFPKLQKLLPCWISSQSEPSALRNAHRQLSPAIRAIWRCF
jgi:hypothetical protein